MNLDDINSVLDAFGEPHVLVDAGRCTHAIARRSTCERCVEACAFEAAQVTADGVKISHARCIGCGACTAVCPTGALVPLEPTDVDLAESAAQAGIAAGGTVVVACERTVAAAGIRARKGLFATVPCLARIDQGFLVRVAAHGAVAIVLADGNCATCKFGACRQAIDAQVAAGNALLSTTASGLRVECVTGLPAFALVTEEELAAAAPAGTAGGGPAAAGASSAESTATRRAFAEVSRETASEDGLDDFGAERRAFFTNTKDQVTAVTSRAANAVLHNHADDFAGKMLLKQEPTLRDKLMAGTQAERLSAAAELAVSARARRAQLMDALDLLGPQPETVVEAGLFGSIHLVGRRCRGCQTCVKLCPTGALCRSQERARRGTMLYEFQACDCVNCGLCVDMCLACCIELRPQVAMDELFNFEPRYFQVPQKGMASSGRKG